MGREESRTHGESHARQGDMRHELSAAFLFFCAVIVETYRCRHIRQADARLTPGRRQGRPKPVANENKKAFHAVPFHAKGLAVPLPLRDDPAATEIRPSYFVCTLMSMSIPHVNGRIQFLSRNVPRHLLSYNSVLRCAKEGGGVEGGYPTNAHIQEGGRSEREKICMEEEAIRERDSRDPKAEIGSPGLFSSRPTFLDLNRLRLRAQQHRRETPQSAPPPSQAPVGGLQVGESHPLLALLRGPGRLPLAHAADPSVWSLRVKESPSWHARLLLRQPRGISRNFRKMIPSKKRGKASGFFSLKPKFWQFSLSELIWLEIASERASERAGERESERSIQTFIEKNIHNRHYSQSATG